MIISIIKLEYIADKDSLKCASCNTQEISIAIEADNVRLALCEHCFKEFVNEATSMLVSLDNKCRFCLHYVKKPDHYNYGGLCNLNKTITYPKNCCGNFRFNTYETDVI